MMGERRCVCSYQASLESSAHCFYFRSEVYVPRLETITGLVHFL